MYMEMEEETVLSSPQSLNSHIFLKSCGSKVSHRDFRLTLMRNVVELAGLQPCPLKTMGRPSALAKRIGCLEDSSHQHRPPTTEGIDRAVRQSHITKQCRIQTAKSIMLGFAYHDISKTITQRPSSRH